MAVTSIRVRFVSVDVDHDSDVWGAGEWHLHATVDGQPVGNSGTEFTARAGAGLTPALAEADWSEVVDVSGKAPGSTVEIRLRIIEDDLFCDDDLGEVSVTVAHPFRNPLQDFHLRSPVIPGGWFGEDRRYYRAHIRVSIEEEFATAVTTGPTAVPVTRTVAGGATFSTIKGTAFVPRLEICPVTPNPSPPAHMPGRPVLPGGLAAPTVPPTASVNAAPSAPALNALANPAVIPFLAATDPQLANRAARLAITFLEPGNLNPNELLWNVRGGPAVIVGSNRGLSVNVRGDRTGLGATPADSMATFDVHWDNTAGPVLATFRAWVGRLGTLPYRVNLLDGSTAALRTTTLMTTGALPAATVNNIMQVAQAILYQAGILLTPDTNVAGYEGATLFPAGNTNAIFRVPVTNNRHTRNVNHNIVSRSTRYNFRPGVINFTFVHSTLQGNAAAVERNGIAGAAGTIKFVKIGKRWFRRHQFDGKGSTKKLGGSPSTSWIKPSGVLKDGAGVQQTLKTISPTDRVKQGAAMDKAWAAARNTAAPPFNQAMMNQLYACHVPAQWGQGNIVGGPPPAWTVAQFVWNCGINLAHELGHILGLAHRGSGGNSAGPSADGMDCKNQKGVMKGHPWNENFMSYGYGMTTPLAHDLDLIQASVVRTHPAITY